MRFGETDIPREMLERLIGFRTHCVKCNYDVGNKCKGSVHDCTKCGYPIGKSASYLIDELFKGIDVPPELIRNIKESLIKNA